MARDLEDLKIINKNLLNQYNNLKDKHLDFLELNDLLLNKKITNNFIKINNNENKNEEIPILMLSDDHYGELIKSKSVNFLNEYNTEIYKKRLNLLINNVLDTINNIKNCSKTKIIINLLGDCISNDIHQDLKLFNEKTVMEQIFEYTEIQIDLINNLLNQGFKNIFIATASGNHDRTTQRKLNKRMFETSYSYLIYKFLAKFFKNDDRVYFKISESEDNIYSVYNTVILSTHGDQFKSSNNNLSNNLLKNFENKQKIYKNNKIDIDLMLIGHFHQAQSIKNKIIINGTLKGYDEYALKNNFDFIKPSQMFLTINKNGINFLKNIEIEEIKKNKTSWVNI